MPAANTFTFTTGDASLPDVGQLNYNGCSFSPLYSTEINGVAVKDEAMRTVKYMEYRLKADGYVTLVGQQASTNINMKNLYSLLTQQGGQLIYKGRGNDFSINTGGRNSSFDVAWGPVPEIVDFQPLGNGNSAKVVWEVTFRIPEQDRATFGPDIPSLGKPDAGGKGVKVGRRGDILQFNYESSVSYGEDGFSELTVAGTLEIPMTRQPNQATRTVSKTADDFRNDIETRVMSGIDLDRFRIVRREFSLSRDKRTLTFNVQAEEKPYMDLPPDCTVARGNYTVRPAKAGMGLVLWLCTLRASYTVAGSAITRDRRPRRLAWIHFLMLLRLRMGQATPDNTNLPDLIGDDQSEERKAKAVDQVLQGKGPDAKDIVKTRVPIDKSRRAFLIDFSVDEGLYLDSKTVTFSATWRLMTTFDHILLASGVWRKMPEYDDQKRNLWATSIDTVMGANSWLMNRADPNLDVIVDFGGG